MTMYVMSPWDGPPPCFFSGVLLGNHACMYKLAVLASQPKYVDQRMFLVLFYYNYAATYMCMYMYMYVHWYIVIMRKCTCTYIHIPQPALPINRIN